MKTRKTFNDRGHAHELTFSTLGRRPTLVRPGAKEVLASSLNRASAKHAFDVWAYVFMPEHVHLLIRPQEESYDVSRILKAIKSPAAKEMLRLDEFRIFQETAVWMPGGGYDRNIRSEAEARIVVEYLHRNPIRRKLCESPDQWLYSSVRDYQGLPGPVNVTLLDWRS